MSTPNGLPLSTDIERMQAAEGIFQNALDAVNTSYQDMTSQQDTLAANWQGETSSAFGIALTQYLEDLGSVRNALASLMNTMGQNTGIYANTNEQSQQVAQAFTGTVNSGSFSGLAGLQLGG
jgi:WXG100 family type VII secretion target